MKLSMLTYIWNSAAILFFLGCSAACESTTQSTTQDDQELSGSWLIPREEVQDGGPGKDGIPSIDEPQFAPIDEIDYIINDRLVIGAVRGGEVKAYPHQILDWHEIVNDKIGGASVAVTYCPLTGTGIGWNRRVNGRVTEFGVSGLLYKNNLIPYDRNSDSRWSQIQLRSVHGPNQGTSIQTVDMLETRWSTWQKMYPDSKVLTTQTGYSRSYQSYTYGKSYLQNDVTLFPVEHNDERYSKKDRVHGVIADSVTDENAEVKVYVIQEMEDRITVINDQFADMDQVVVGSAELDFAASFHRTLDGSRLTFKPVTDALPIVMQDQEGNRWDIFGNALEGPREGQQLIPTESFTGYWFAWVDFYPKLEVYKHP